MIRLVFAGYPGIIFGAIILAMTSAMTMIAFGSMAEMDHRFGVVELGFAVFFGTTLTTLCCAGAYIFFCGVVGLFRTVERP